MTGRACVVVAAAMLAWTMPARQAQQVQQPTFRTGVNTVPIYATVIDKYGGMVLNLTQGDFTVLDNDKPQMVTTFERGLQPVTAMVLLDRSASMTLNLELSLAAAEQFVIRMLPGDRARIGTFSDRIEIGATFSHDRDAILRELRDDLHFGNPTKLWDAVDETMTALAPIGGRRVILLLTDGMDTISRKRADDILGRAREDELMIYVVQFRSNYRANLGEVMPGQPDNARFRNPPPTETLRRLATQTGGGHFVLGRFDDLNSTFTRVMHELHYQYVLGFTPQKLDGKVHDLTVRANNRDYVVRARQNYLANLPRGDR